MKNVTFIVLLVLAILLVGCGQEEITPSDVEAVAKGLPVGSTILNETTDEQGNKVQSVTQWGGIQPTMVPLQQTTAVPAQPTAVPAQPTAVPAQPTADPCSMTQLQKEAVRLAGGEDASAKAKADQMLNLMNLAMASCMNVQITANGTAGPYPEEVILFGDLPTYQYGELTGTDHVDHGLPSNQGWWPVSRLTPGNTNPCPVGCTVLWMNP